MKRNFQLLTLAVILSTTNALAQPDTLWTRLYGGPADDNLYGAVATPDNGAVLLIKQSVTADSSYSALLRIDAQGDSIWSCSLQWESGRDHLSGHDDTLVVARLVYDELVFVWISPEGQIVRRINKEFRYADHWRQFIDLGVAGFLIRGESYSPDYPLLFRLDTSADTLWRHEFRSDYEIFGDEVIALNDGGFAQLNHFGLNGQYDIGLVRLDADGQTVFDLSYGGNGSSKPWGIWENADGTFTILAQWLAYDSLCFLQIDDDGELLATSRSINPPGYGSTPGDAFLLNDDTFLVWNNRRNVRDPWIAQVTVSGDVLWRQDFYEVIQDIVQTDDSRLIFATSLSDRYRGRFRNQDIWVGRIEFPPDVVGIDPVLPLSTQLLSAYPNPFNSTAVIEYGLDRPGFVRLGVYDVTGRFVAPLIEGVTLNRTGRIVWNSTNLPVGKYQILLTSPEGNATIGLSLIR